MDLRSVKQSELARAKGGGIEPETHYTLWKKINKPVDFSSESYSKFIEGALTIRKASHGRRSSWRRKKAMLPKFLGFSGSEFTRRQGCRGPFIYFEFQLQKTRFRLGVILRMPGNSAFSLW